ncbi:adenylate/guanylate cyclase domain-containing protein [Agrobacterium vitis]|uniref:adenylate/guanylate cyclase domain-containing protein n=1 Tax=Agrobacterium vitis TaxID=373 RepID=UPI0012E80805|nr:adenylate/guanylate cyclase domain-containing protein [Agrobacterium vitis]MUZ66119.1 adenylate/guanylate cyclase domain-containing protein [Agrobacterium vitis]
MKTEEVLELILWLSNQALEGNDNSSIFRGFCDRCVQAGLAISHAVAVIDTLHPEFEGSAFEWSSAASTADKTEQKYQSTNSGRAREIWETSVFNHLLVTGDIEVRRELAKGAPLDFHRLAELKSAGHTDYLATIHRFSESGSIGEMTAVYSALATKAKTGFCDDDLQTLRKLLPMLALALKNGTSMNIVRTLAEVYLGHDAAERVINGQITQGAAEAIDAVIWFSDLKNYTAISDQAEPEQIIPFLNDYSGLAIDCIHRHGGSVLKLIGDGILAIFKGPDMQKACASALDAEYELRSGLKILDARRSTAGAPITGIYVGMHIGRVFFGNIGSSDRLDFTVVGPAVNEVSRICGTCRPSGNDLLLSGDFAEACSPDRQRQFQPVGEFSLRGVAEAKILLTLSTLNLA